MRDHSDRVRETALPLHLMRALFEVRMAKRRYQAFPDRRAWLRYEEARDHWDEVVAQELAFIKTCRSMMTEMEQLQSRFREAKILAESLGGDANQRG